MSLFFFGNILFSSDAVLFCLRIVFTNSVFQVPPQKIVRWVEILGIGWPGVISLTRNESVPWEVMPREDITRKEIRLIPQEMLNRIVDNFNVRVAAALSYSNAVHGTNIVLITEKV